MPKAKQAEIPKTDEKQEARVLYDAGKAQSVPLTIEKNGQEFVVRHNLAPLTNERFFEYSDQVETVVKRLKNLSTAILDPQYKLWLDLVQGREGYKDRDDWKAATHRNDAVAAIAGLIHVRVLDNEEVEAVNEVVVYDEDALTEITFHALQGGVLLTLSHSFREETKAEADEYMSIEVNQPNDSNLASAERLSKNEALCRLGNKLLKGTEGYAEGSEVPAWHLAATTETFFVRQAARLGKFLRP